jgi:hypothetical protein
MKPRRLADSTGKATMLFALVISLTLLLVTAIAKLFSAVGSAPILDATDEVIGVKVRTAMVGGAVIELSVCVILAIGIRNGFWRGFCLVSLGVQFALYHLTRHLMGISGPCPCLGTAWRWLPWGGVTESDVARVAVYITAAITACVVLLMYAHRRQLPRAQ